MIAAALVALLWLTLTLHLARLRHRAPTMPAAAAAIPPTTILLPVRDEEENVVPCVESLLDQSGSPAVAIVDDGSTDATPALLRALASRAPRVRLLDARPLPEGWSGKTNALATAFASTETDWVLLTDADSRHAPDLLARTHAAVARHGLDALSLAARQEARGLGENLITPPVFALLDLGLGDWEPHARGEGRPPVANGQYFLLRAAALRAIGGFASIAGKQLDDVALAEALVAGGFRVGFRRSGAALSVRMYRGLAASFNGWRRNLALILAGGGHRPAASAVAAMALLAFVPATLARVAGDPLVPLLAVTWAGCALASTLVRASAGHRWLYGLLAPLDLFALAALLVVARADWRRGHVAAWKGRPGPSAVVADPAATQNAVDRREADPSASSSGPTS